MSDVTHYVPIGVMQTCFREKFGAPRQSRMIPAATGVLKLNAHPDFRAALGHLESFSHLWIVYVFHRHLDEKFREPWRPTIHPPRVDAPPGIGVFASRSPHRPNPIGLSVVKLERIDLAAPGGIEIHVSGVDILDGTPVLDIKPYLPFVDRVDEANGGWAEGEIPRYPVEFLPGCVEVLQDPVRERALIEQMLALDPRPTSQRRILALDSAQAEGRPFAFRVLDYDVHWQMRCGVLQVTRVENLTLRSTESVETK